MKMKHSRQAAAWLLGIALASAAFGTASAAGLQPGEYTCAGSSGILIGLGFILRGDGTYTDLDRKSTGRINFNGTSATFIGGHLDGQVARNIRGGRNFEIGSISCSHN
jgi:hypothetical protein